LNNKDLLAERVGFVPRGARNINKLALDQKPQNRSKPECKERIGTAQQPPNCRERQARGASRIEERVAVSVFYFVDQGDASRDATA
jgi:hypothetical protein